MHYYTDLLPIRYLDCRLNHSRYVKGTKSSTYSAPNLKNSDHCTPYSFSDLVGTGKLLCGKCIPACTILLRGLKQKAQSETQDCKQKKAFLCSAFPRPHGPEVAAQNEGGQVLPHTLPWFTLDTECCITQRKSKKNPPAKPLDCSCSNFA